MQASFSTRVAYWRRMLRLHRRERHARVIHAKAQMPVDMEQVRELTAALELPPDSTAYKVALLETDAFRFLMCESLSLDDDGLRLQKAIFERAAAEPELAAIVSEEVNDAPIGRLMRALILESVRLGCSAVVFEQRDEVMVASRAKNGEILPRDPIPRNLWEPMLGWAVRTRAIGWEAIRRWYRDDAELPADLMVEVTERTFCLCWD
jgi:hypothetical protein